MTVDLDGCQIWHVLSSAVAATVLSDLNMIKYHKWKFFLVSPERKQHNVQEEYEFEQCLNWYQHVEVHYHLGQDKHHIGITVVTSLREWNRDLKFVLEYLH